MNLPCCNINCWLRLALFFLLTAADVQVRAAISAKDVTAICRIDSTDLWVATRGGLYRQGTDGVLQPTPLPSLTHHPYPTIYALAHDVVRGRLWVAAWNHLYCYDLLLERFITTTDSAINRTVRISCDSLGRVLAYTEHGLFRFTMADGPTPEQTERIDAVRYEKPTGRVAGAEKLVFPVARTEKDANLSLWMVVVLLLFFLLGLLIYRHKAARTAKPQRAKRTVRDDTAQQAEFLQKARLLADAHLADPEFGIDQFAQEMAVSRAQLFRKLKAANGQTPNEFLTEHRMRAAATMLTSGQRTITDVATAVGFTDSSNFRRTFKKYFGKSPTDYVRHDDITNEPKNITTQ